MSGPLSGVTVVDLTANLMGPYCTMIMGDLGAEVVKVERLEGDTLRNVGPARHRGMGGIFLNLNRNKRSIALDISEPAGRGVLLRLAERCDVFVHSMRPQTMATLGLDQSEVRKVNAGVIYCGMYGFGQNGPYAGKAAYDDIVQGVSGHAAVQGSMTGVPQYVASAIADKTPGMTAAYAVLAALFHRERTGEGQDIDVPMFETMVANLMVEHTYGMMFEPAIGTAVYPRLTSAYRKPYPTRDGYVCFVVYTDEQWKKFFNSIGRSELIGDERFSDIGRRTENIDELYEIVSEMTKSRTTDEWREALDRLDIPVAPMNTPDQLVEDPHLATVGLFEMAEHPTEGTIRHTGVPVSFSRSPGEIRRCAPRLGADSVEILEESGYSEDEIADLISNMITVEGK